MVSPYPSNMIKAKQDFSRARRQAALRAILSRYTGQSIGLLSYEDVRQKIKAQGSASRGIQDIPLDSIVGSVGRYADFTRDFLPLQDEIESRWVNVKMAYEDLKGVPPIDVYKIGEVYFVLDGNHRVSVARQLGATHIQANVIEIKTKVLITPDVKPDDLITKSEYADFLERTRLDELRPGLDLGVSVCGQYSILEEHIHVHRYFMGIEQQREIPYEEAAAHWYDTVYLPVVQTIRQYTLLRDFPGYTETDLYLWISEHRVALENELGWLVKTEEFARHLAAQQNQRSGQLASRLGGRIIDAVLPDEFESGPPPGDWRRGKETTNGDGPLFGDILVPISVEETGWNALEQAIVLARLEQSWLHGLYVVPTESEKDSPEAQQIKLEFESRLQRAGIPGNIIIAAGVIWREICRRSRWADLLTLNLAHPPSPQPIARLGSGMTHIIRSCPSPILVTPGAVTNLESALLAYDASPKAEEALYLAAYFALKCKSTLTVLTVIEKDREHSDAIQRARSYLESTGVQADYLQIQGVVSDVVLETAETLNVQLILMGGYGLSPLVEVVLGSAVDQVMRQSRWPVMVCR